ncbi:amino acid transporter [Cucurbitaria berberidis CBS 394.84]|uniref:Amino acid transporter n=1 Tax=Cucurbitaria berberidis CBS 394.84 TaxID=1168544 RepID=A0A9P4L8J0_9PLEO|nr:amino acid transporter [Cucurbitaria berberidis CBS 394.84]KAF1846141.1 amino acid transporter [Cucurbitaria berberidis CBS 394.84]
MSEKATINPTPQASDGLDAIATQEAIEDQRRKTEQEQSGGALQRYINAPSAINFSLLLQCSWEAAAVTFQFSLTNGGPASIAYGSIFAGLGTTLVALSLAEMASMDPTVGAQYRWSAAFAPKWNRFFGLMQGWITVFAWICSCTSNPALISNIVVGLASFNNEAYVPLRWHSTLIMWSLTVFPFVGNFWLPRFINPLETVGAVCHVVFFFASIITLAVMADKSSVEYVFHTLTHDVSGWTNPAVAWGLGLLTVTYPLTGFDGVLHMSDEVQRARLRIPRSMILSVIINSTMQFLYMITVLFCIGDVTLVSASPLPIIQVYYQATGSRAATNLFVVMLLFIIFVSFFNVFASVSRLVWAFSRDDGLPFARVFASVHPRFKMPVNALCLIAVCLVLLALINIGSSTAFNAFISLPALALYISYFFPIFFLSWRRLAGRHSTPIPWGPFKLGKAGPYVNLGAMCYILFILIWMPFPAMLPVDGLTMNYAGPIVGAVVVGAALDWTLNGRKRFQVPVAGHEL